MTRRLSLACLALAGLLAAAMLGGCSTGGKTEAVKPAEATATPAAVKIGTLATEDSLPLWVAEDRGYFAVEGLPKVEIVTF
ncbi:MAG: ABC transporter substrate-binding protein, partial [Actinobacteria bacterium]